MRNIKYGRNLKWVNVLFEEHQSTAHENDHKFMMSYGILWCQPHNKFKKIVKFGQVIKCENALFYVHQSTIYEDDHKIRMS